MGAKLDTPARVRGPVCPLCHCECKNPTVLKCRHRFCEECIGELWSGSLSGPVFCPECKQEYRKLTDAFWDTETSFPSASRYPSGWRDKFSSPASKNSLLGKRRNSRIPQPQESGQRQVSSPATNGTARSDGFAYHDGEPPPRKKTHSTPGINPSSNTSTPKNHGSVKRSSSDRSSLPLEGTSATVWCPDRSTGRIPVSEGLESPESDDSSVEEVLVVSGVPSESQSPVVVETPLEEPTLKQQTPPKTSTPPVQKSPRATTPAMDMPPATRSPSVSGSPPAAPSPSVSGSPPAARSPSVSGSPPAARSPSVSGSPPAARSPSVSGSPPAARSPSVSGSPPAARSRSVSGSPPAARSPSVSGSPPATSSPRQLSPAANHQSFKRMESPPTRDTIQPAALGLVPCHYCFAQDQRPAVKTCLQCGASMCAEHLRTHLESPVFQGHPLVPAVNDVSPWRCQEHQEMNRIYCRPCGVCVCTVCTVIGSHRDHPCIGIKEAEKELRGEMKEEMKKLQGHEQAVMTRKAELLQKKQAFQEVLDEARGNVRTQYQAMREALDHEEQQALLCVAKEETRSLGGVEDQLGLLQTTLGTIQHSVDTLTGLADATGALRVQDQAFITEYNKVASRISGISNPVEDLEAPREVDRARLGCLQGWTERRLDTVIISRPHRDPFRLMYGITPLLDPDTAHPKLLLSMDNRRVSFSDTPQPHPEHDARFSSFPQVLASGALCYGRWYWEVEVAADEGRWKVGVCDGQIGRKGQKDACRMGFNGLSWCLLSEGKGKVEVLHDKESTAVCANAPPRVGVLLDFEEGSLSFFSVAEEGTLTLLYSYQHAFTQPLYPALAVSKTQLTICDLFQRDGADESNQE